MGNPVTLMYKSFWFRKSYGTGQSITIKIPSVPKNVPKLWCVPVGTPSESYTVCSSSTTGTISVSVVTIKVKMICVTLVLGARGK